MTLFRPAVPGRRRQRDPAPGRREPARWMPAAAARLQPPTRTASSTRTGGPISSATARSTAPSGRSRLPRPSATRSAPEACSWRTAATTSRFGTWSMMTAAGSRPASRPTSASTCRPTGRRSWPGSAQSSTGRRALQSVACPATASPPSAMAGSSSSSATRC